jgi:hypothetical protein
MAAFLKKHNQPDGRRDDICSEASALRCRGEEFACDDPVAPFRKCTPGGQLFSGPTSTRLGETRPETAARFESIRC